jgi:hypothetical protein
MEPKGITLKKYSADNLTDYDIEYIRIDDEQTMKFHYDVFFNGKKLGEIHGSKQSSGMGGSGNMRYEFKPHIFGKDDHLPVTWASVGNMPDLKKNIENQIKGIAKFIMRYYENK